MEAFYMFTNFINNIAKCIPKLITDTSTAPKMSKEWMDNKNISMQISPLMRQRIADIMETHTTNTSFYGTNFTIFWYVWSMYTVLTKPLR